MRSTDPPRPTLAGADLRRLAIVPDLRAVSVAEGMRAAMASAVPIVLYELTGWSWLVEAALAANLACLCDAGGSMRRRLSGLLAFAIIGAAMTGGYGLLRDWPLPIWLAVASFGIFCTAYARVWNNAAMQVGNLLSVVQVLALDRQLDVPEAATLGLAFLGGAIWALLLTAVIWRIRPTLPARRAVAAADRQLALFAADLRALLLRDDTEPADWELHARAHRRAVRLAIETARTALMDNIRVRGPAGMISAHGLLRLEAADQIFGRLIALSELLETAGSVPGPVHAAADVLLRLLRPMLVVLGDAVLRNRTLDGARLDRGIGQIAVAVADAPLLRPLAEAMVEKLRIAATLAAPDGYLPGDPAAPSGQGWRLRILGPLRGNLNRESATLRHAVRAAAMCAPALVIAQQTGVRGAGNWGHWLPITVLMVLQPYFATTWQRALERIGGTVLGGLAAAGLGVVCSTPLGIAVAMFPLCIVAFAMRAMSYGLFMVGLTPIVVLLSELGHGGTGWRIAGLRAGFTIIGGALAVLGCRILWPSWEPDRLRRQLRAALLAHAAYADAALGRCVDGKAIDEARRAAGLASNELETSLSRALLEPQRRQDGLDALLTVDACLRRLAGRLSTLQLDRGRPAAEHAAIWRGWVSAALRGLADGKTLPTRPGLGTDEALFRIARQIELMHGALHPDH